MDFILSYFSGKVKENLKIGRIFMKKPKTALCAHENAFEGEWTGAWGKCASEALKSLEKQTKVFVRYGFEDEKNFRL